MTTTAASAFTFSLGRLYVYLVKTNNVWRVGETSYNGGLCAGTAHDCAPEALAWSNRIPEVAAGYANLLLRP
jgi:hypothetical protein